MGAILVIAHTVCTLLRMGCRGADSAQVVLLTVGEDHRVDRMRVVLHVPGAQR